ncbi:MAG: hypothetical protein EPN89_00360, partial [Methylovulum sp.]
LPLPTYPFAKQRHWLARADINSFLVPAGQAPLDRIQMEPPAGDNIRETLLAILSQILGTAPDTIRTNKNIRDYGADSIVAMHLMRDIEERFAVKLSGRELLEYSTVDSLAGHIASKKEPARSALSEGQKGLWLLQKFSPLMGAYNVPLAFRIKRGFDDAAFSAACEDVLKCHALLRTVIREHDGEPYQVIVEFGDPVFDQAVRRENIAHLDEDDVLPYLTAKVKTPFDLETGPLLRVDVLSRPAHETLVLVTVHHIIFDGSSALLLIDALWKAYFARLQHSEPELAPVGQAAYYDFVQWEQAMLAGDEGRDHLAYWKQQLAGELPVLALPADHPRRFVQTFNGHSHECRLEPALTQKLREFAPLHGVNLSVLYLAVFTVLLYRYTGQNDILVGMPTLGRPQRRFEALIGYFINMVVIRSRLSGETRFTELLKTLQLTVLDGLDHAALPFPVLVRELAVSRDQAMSPVYQVSFAYQNFARPLEHAETGIALVEGIHQEGEDELGLEVYEEKDRTLLKMDFRPDVFELSTIQRMMAHTVNLLEDIVVNAGNRVADLAML